MILGNKRSCQRACFFTALTTMVMVGASGWAHAQDAEQIKELGVITVTALQPTSLPTQIPTTTHSITGREIEDTLNATDSEDALKYFPSLLVRKRYQSDYNHAMLSSRASGTSNPARSAVYADGILLSNFLGNSVSGLSFPPRWGMVTPDEIERVDVMYGPFSAAYPGNSVGAVVDYVTRMPTQYEVHVRTGFTAQPVSLYNTNTLYKGWQTSASVGNKSNDWSWLLNFHHTDSQSQPLTFATRKVSDGVAPTTGVTVQGAVAGKNTTNGDIYVIGTGTQYHTQQDHMKAKLAYDVTPTVRASYVLGLWQNTAEGRSSSYLTNASGAAVMSGPIVINGQQFSDNSATSKLALTGADFPLTHESLTHYMHGLSLKTHTRDTWDWEVAASLYDYAKDQKRQNAASTTTTNGAGTVANGAGSGWHNLVLRGTWRPQGIQGEHVVDFGFQQDHYKLDYETSTVANNWTTDPAGSLVSRVGGRTQLDSVYAQDAWRFAPRWKTVLGMRSESWSAHGYTVTATPAVNNTSPNRTENFFSPKAAVSYQWAPDTVLKASVGRAVRMPTAFELYGANSTNNTQYINDPHLKPEKSWTTEFSWEKDWMSASWRVTYFKETTRDGLFSQGVLDTSSNKTVTTVQNVGRIATQGLETALMGENIGVRGLDLSASVTYTDSIIKDNTGYITAPGDTLGKMQPNIPHWRASSLGSYRFDDKWTGSLGARYSGTQYRTLNNSDVNGFTYMGVSKFFTLDLRLRYKVDKQWSVAFGIDNLNNYQYWNFHPYPQRSYFADLKFDL